MALKFSMILEAVDRASAPARKVKASVGGLVSGFRAWGQQVAAYLGLTEGGVRNLFKRLERRASDGVQV